MRYAVTLIQNDTIAACMLYDEKKAALAKYHHEMEYACNADVTTLCMVATTNGAIIASEKYTAPPVESGEE